LRLVNTGSDRREKGNFSYSIQVYLTLAAFAPRPTDYYPLCRARTNRTIGDRRDSNTANMRSVTHARNRRLISTHYLDSSTPQNIPRHMTRRSITTRLETRVRAIRVPSVCASSTWLAPLFLGEPLGDVAPEPQHNVTITLPGHRPKN
jgi:hypothetical protein